MWVQPIPMLQDELLSSWLVRASLTMGCDSTVLTKGIWPNRRAWTIDIDRALTKEHFIQLQEFTMLSTESIDNSLLLPLAEKISSKSLPSGIWPWILSTGARNRKRRAGPQFCPACFASSKRPYLCRSMRLAWHTCCVTHGLQLLDECLACHAPLEPHRLKIEDNSITVCATCHTDLSLQHSIDLSPTALKFQQETDLVLMKGGGNFFGAFVCTTQWFKLCDYCISLIRRSSRTHFERLKAVLFQLDVVYDNQAINDLGIEQLSTSERTILFENVWALSRHSADDFQFLLNQSSCTQETIRMSHNDVVPELLAPMIRSLPTNRSFKAVGSKRRVRSKYLVEKMMAHLVRKLRMRER